MVTLPVVGGDQPRPPQRLSHIFIYFFNMSDTEEDSDFEDVFFEAIREQNMPWVQELLPLVDLSARVEGLAYAAQGGRMQCLHFLLAEGVPPAHNEAKASPLHCAANSRFHQAVTLLLAAPGAQVDALCRSGRTPLHYAKTARVARTLINARADVNAGDGKVPLHSAAWEGRAAVVRELLTHPNIVVDMRDYFYGMTPLHKAAIGYQRGCTECVAVLLRAGGDPCALDNLNRTPMHFVHAAAKHPWPCGVKRRLYFIARLLICAGARDWDVVPKPCFRLEAALSTVWKKTPEDLKELFKCLEPAVQARIQETLRALHHGARPFDGLDEPLRMRLLYMTLVPTNLVAAHF